VSRLVTTKRVLWTSFFVDALDILVNIVIAIITGSAVMLAEALQGFADLASVTMLLIGFQRSKKRSDKQHPFGYGKEQYFWALIAVFLIIGITATMSVYAGLQKWLNPEDVEFLPLAYAALVVSVITNGYALTLSLRKLLKSKPVKTLPRVFVESPDVAPRTTMVLDTAGTLAAVFGLSALAVYGFTGDARLDGLGAILIGILLFVLALTMLFTTKELVTGRSASVEVETAITNAAHKVPEVQKVLDLRTMMMGSESLLINVRVHLKDDLSTDEVEKVIDKTKDKIRDNISFRAHINIEPETPPRRRSKR